MSVILNIILFIFKLLAGKMSGSVSIVADAFNNLTDAGTVLFSTIGVKISSIGPGMRHPDGHGKFEWVFALITSFSVLLVGWELFRDSVANIIEPQDTVFSWSTFSILAVSILIKIFLYSYNIKKSKDSNSLSLKAVAIDSLSDAFSTSAVLISLMLNKAFEWQLDGFFGLAVSVLIMYNALKCAIESIECIVGMTGPENKVEELSNTIKSFFDSDVPVIDLKISDYGYSRYKVFFHILSTEQVTADEILTEVPIIQKEISREYGYDTLIQVEKTSDRHTSEEIIITAKKNLIEAGYPYQMVNSRVVVCKNNTYQLVSTILIPFTDKGKIDELNKIISSPESLGMNKNDSTLIKVMFMEHKRKHKKIAEMLTQNA